MTLTGITSWSVRCLQPDNSFKPTPHRGVGHVPTLRWHASATPLWDGLIQASGCTTTVIATLTMQKTIASALLAIALFAVLSLVFGATYLEAALPGGLPFGNALAALGLCAVAGAAVALSTRSTALRAVSLFSLIAAAVWLPASIALAGNLALNFDGGRGLAWAVLNLGVVGLVFGALVWALAAALLAMRKRSGAA